jgi:hypothetical protein
MKKKKIEKEEKKIEEKMLCITEKELMNPMIKRKICELVTLRAGFHSTEPFLQVSEAEEKIMQDLPLFISIKEYKEKKFPNEIGKLRGQRVCLIKNK